MQDWYDETERRDSIGEINVPAMAFAQGLVTGNGITRIAQCGGYYGYSTLLFGFMLRAMDAEGAVVSIDIDPDATAFTEKYVKRAGLERWIKLHVGDSADPASRQVALDHLGGDPELLLIDSSHQYAHTLRELDLWIPALPPGAIALLHDTSDFARDFDPTKEGGVKRAVEEWMPRHPEVAFLSLNGAHPWGADGNELAYKDGCGLGIMQRLPD
jgi:predicted O-methyltransferase YrrM